MRQATKLLKLENNDKMSIVLGKGLITLNNERWQEHRTALSQGFRYNEFKRYLPHFMQKTQTLIKVSKNELTNDKSKNYIDFMKHFTCCTLGIITKLICA